MLQVHVSQDATLRSWQPHLGYIMALFKDSWDPRPLFSSAHHLHHQHLQHPLRATVCVPVLVEGDTDEDSIPRLEQPHWDVRTQGERGGLSAADTQRKAPLLPTEGHF